MNTYHLTITNSEGWKVEKKIVAASLTAAIDLAEQMYKGCRNITITGINKAGDLSANSEE